MILLIAGQDIHELSLALIPPLTKGGLVPPSADPPSSWRGDDGGIGGVAEEIVLKTTPEGYLSAIDETLKQWNVSLDDLAGITVVTGPGSFTSSRISVTIANAIAFAKHLPLRTLENPKRLSLAQLVESTDWSLPQKGHIFAVPTYDRPPHITSPRI